MISFSVASSLELHCLIIPQFIQSWDPVCWKIFSARNLKVLISVAVFFFPCCLFWCVCFMFKSCGLVWRQPEKNQTVQVVSEGPIRVSAECVMPTDAPAGRCRGLKKKEHLHRPARYICWVASPPASVKCASRGRQTFCSQHVSSPRESITFHKQMLTIKRVH